MSTTFFFNPPSPVDEFHRTFNQVQDQARIQTGLVIGLTIGSIIVVAIILFFLCKSRTKIRHALVSDIRAVMAPSTPTPPVFQLSEVDDPAMEAFFQELAQQKPVRFTAQHLYNFTENYSKMLGSGGFGKVYKGQFPNGVKIAVKVLNRVPNGNIEEQFMAEAGTIGRTHHINLVRLYGFCYDQFISALVYEYMENGSLDTHLFKEVCELEWEKLHEIAIGTAKGIAYLHEECDQRIIHYDIKPGNVLLDANFFPKVADFGLAKLCNRDATHVSVTGYRGTPGYLAPEFMLRNFAITYKCDVYSFGIMLFEIIGRRTNTRMGGGDSVDWFPKHLWEEYEKGEITTLIETCGIGEKDRAKAERTAMVALWCVQDSPEARPPMSAVVKMLEGGVEIVPPQKPFRYLFSVGMDVLMAQSDSWNSTNSSTNQGNNSLWYKDNGTPITSKYEINIATL